VAELTDPGDHPGPVRRGAFFIPWIGTNGSMVAERSLELGADFLSVSVKDSMGRSWSRSDVVPTWKLRDDPFADLCEALHEAGMSVRASVAVFADAYAADRWPDAVAVGNDTVSAQRPGWAEDWYYHLCPVQDRQRDRTLAFIDELARRYPLDGVDLDFIRFPWKPARDQTPARDFCYCPTCQKRFTASTGAEVAQLHDPAVCGSWESWRTGAITSMVESVRDITASHDISLSCFLAFWGSDGLGSAELPKARARFGQDHAALGSICDEVAPMLYHRFTDEPTCHISRSIRWVRDITWHLRELDVRVCAAIQGGPPASPGEITDAVHGAVDAGAAAVMSYPGLSWSIDNEYWAALARAYAELTSLAEKN
jgi:uncharacterized lipoprotein YddW (UPF0748 family)